MTVRISWSLNVDEAIVVDKIKKELSTDYEVFFPANSQLQDIDLIIFNLRNDNARTVQVKGSRAYTGKKDGFEYSWIGVKKNPSLKLRTKLIFSYLSGIR
jgi:hypothetical protein